MKYDARACHFNMDTGCVELLLRDGRMISMQNIVIVLGIKSVFLVLGALGMAGMWEAVFGDVGVTIIAVLNAMRILKK